MPALSTWSHCEVKSPESLVWPILHYHDARNNEVSETDRYIDVAIATATANDRAEQLHLAVTIKLFKFTHLCLYYSFHAKLCLGLDNVKTIHKPTCLICDCRGWRILYALFMPRDTW